MMATPFVFMFKDIVNLALKFNKEECYRTYKLAFWDFLEGFIYSVMSDVIKYGLHIVKNILEYYYKSRWLNLLR
jgi:hypothetical protein